MLNFDRLKCIETMFDDVFCRLDVAWKESLLKLCKEDKRANEMLDGIVETDELWNGTKNSMGLSVRTLRMSRIQDGHAHCQKAPTSYSP